MAQKSVTGRWHRITERCTLRERNRMGSVDLVASEGIPIGHKPADKCMREMVVRLLSSVPGLVQSMREMGADTAFRVVMRGENAHLFKQAADGFYKPFLHDGRSFVENVNLAKVAPDYGRVAADLAAQVQMAAIMAKLDRIEGAVRKADEGRQDACRKEVAGGVIALRIAAALGDPRERRSQMLLACNTATVALTVLAGQLKSNIEAMPEQGGWFDGIFNDPSEDARRAFDAVAYDMAAVKDGCRAVLHAYDELGEPAAARAALASFVGSLRAASIEAAARKARLVPGERGKPAPEERVRWFNEAVEGLHGYVLDDGRSGEPPTIRMDVKLGELEVGV